MLKKIIQSTVIISSLTTSIYAQNNLTTLKEKAMTTINEASYITFNAKKGYESKLKDFLNGGANLVKQTEPSTLLWAALQKDENSFTIFDTFHDKTGQDAHFSGKVATALMENAPTLVEDGWDKGVVQNIKNVKVLSFSIREGMANKVKKAIFIPVKAKAGKEQAVADFLKSGAAIVKETEPKTLYWYALQLSKNEFAIIDFFEDQSGIDAHFSGKVATALNANSDTLIVGGWEDGVVKNIQASDVIKLIEQN